RTSRACTAARGAATAARCCATWRDRWPRSLRATLAFVKAAYYERVGPAREVLTIGEIPVPQPAAGEVRVRVEWSGVNPSDVKSRGGSRPMAFPRVIPHSDGAGIVDGVGPGVPDARI